MACIAAAVVASVLVLAFFASYSSAGKGPMVTDVVSSVATVCIHMYAQAYCDVPSFFFRFISISPSGSSLREGSRSRCSVKLFQRP